MSGKDISCGSLAYRKRSKLRRVFHVEHSSLSKAKARKNRFEEFRIDILSGDLLHLLEHFIHSQADDVQGYPLFDFLPRLSEEMDYSSQFLSLVGAHQNQAVFRSNHGLQFFHDFPCQDFFPLSGEG